MWVAGDPDNVLYEAEPHKEEIAIKNQQTLDFPFAAK